MIETKTATLIVITLTIMALSLVASPVPKTVMSVNAETFITSSICGEIVDSFGSPVYMAKVEVSNSSIILANMTDEKGTYCFPNLAPGNYTVRIIKFGMQPIILSVELVDNRVAVLNDINDDIERVLVPIGYRIVDYSLSVSDLINDIPQYKVVIINRFVALPTSSTILNILERANASGVSLIFLDTNSTLASFGGSNTLTNYAIHVLAYWKSVIESNGFPAPDLIREGSVNASSVYVKVINTSSNLFTNISYDYPSDIDSFYLANRSVSQYALYSAFSFNETSVKPLASLIVNNSVTGYYAAYWISGSGTRWYFISVGPSYLMGYSTLTSTNSIYSNSAIETLVNAVRDVMPLPEPLGRIVILPEPGTYFIGVSASLSFDNSGLKAYISIDGIDDPTATWVTSPSNEAHIWLPPGSYTLSASNPVYGQTSVDLVVTQNSSVNISFRGRRICVIGDWRDSLIEFINKSVGLVVDHYEDVTKFLSTATFANYSVVIVNTWYNPYNEQAPNNFLENVVSFMDASYNSGFSVIYLDTWFMYITTNNEIIDDVTGVQAVYKFKNNIPYQYGYAAPISRDQDYGVGKIYIVINSSSPIFDNVGSVGDKIYVNVDTERQDFAWINGIYRGYKVLETKNLAIIGADNLPQDYPRWGIVEVILNNRYNSKWFFVTYAADIWPGEDYSGNGYTEEAKLIMLNILRYLVTGEGSSSTLTTTETTTTDTNSSTITTVTLTTTETTTQTTTITAISTTTETITETYTKTEYVTKTATTTVTNATTITETIVLNKTKTITLTSSASETYIVTSAITKTETQTVTVVTTLTETATKTVMNITTTTYLATITKEIQIVSAEIIGIAVVSGVAIGLVLGYILKRKSTRLP